MIYDSVLDLIGNTPMVKLNRITTGLAAEVVVKVEYLNPGGSVKDRIAVKMVDAAEAEGLIKPGGTIVDLGGNVSEWMLDLWNRIDEPCWQRPGIYSDPKCTSLSEHDGHLVAVRGGNWGETFRALEAASRRARDPISTNLDVGFRCAWPSPFTAR